MSRKSILIILDGFGIGKHDHSDAVWEANTPFTDRLSKEYPHTRLLTHGEHVGLPDGQMGNSEVGHMNIGAGRVVWQMLVRINKSIRDGELALHPVLLETMQRVKREGKAIHFLGLLGDGGVHASSEHLFALCDIAKEQGLERVYIHAFLDGRDTDPRSGAGFLEELYRRIEDTPAKLASLIGRYYAMDRDKRWERVKKAYDLLVHGEGIKSENLLESVREHYSRNITDEFMEPLLAEEDGKPVATIQPGDALVFFNFRTDRGRQLTQVLTQQDMPEFGMHTLPLDYLTFTSYDHSYHNVKVLFEDQNLNHTLGQVISDAGLRQLRAAETEKYPHVTFFFSGGREDEFPGESRVLVASPKVATYDLKPEMSAFELRDKLLEQIRSQSFDFACINFANPDMVGHTGVYPAIVKAVETVDRCAQDLVEEGLKQGYDFLIIADHGNADFAVNADGTPNTAHSMNPVPCWLVSNDLKPNLREGILADVAPTILKMMQIPQPADMSGQSLF
ncbi:MAG: 2,3-bisphosphoglycerate-independent phosphoglycerate mutase [Bacteroidetes bacterium]|nr:2,3-bisphosphoglycerate-independent phosphoglycerate mutase [Bacteroidota bacterium]